MRDEAAFLAAIRRAPYDALIRLVYADWLEERRRTDEALLLRWQASKLTSLKPTDIDPEQHQFDDPEDAEGARMPALCNGFDKSWLLRVRLDFAVPPGLSADGLAAVDAVIDLLASYGEWNTANAAPAFREPTKWARANPWHGPPVNRAVLVVRHNEGCLKYYFREDMGVDGVCPILDEWLRGRGFRSEMVNFWYSLLYRPPAE